MASFASLPPRPPTPPRETSKAIDDALEFLDTSVDVEQPQPKPQTVHQLGHVGLNTPPCSSPNHSSDLETAKAHKRIRFVPEPILCDDPSAVVRPKSTLKTLPPSKEQQSSRSILKSFELRASNDTIDAEPLQTAIVPHRFSSLAAMLESLLKQLAGKDRTSRLHAYITLSTSIRAYGDDPELNALQENMPILEKHLQRDIAAVHPGTEAPDAKIRAQALKCASVLLWKCHNPQGFSNDFLSFLLEHSIEVIESHDIPKEVMVNQLYLLTSKRLFARDVSPEAIGKILAALREIHERVGGSNVLWLRVSIYHQLILCTPSVMVDKADMWLLQLLSSTLSSVNETSQRAIETGIAAGLSFGNSKRIAHTMRQLLINPETLTASAYLNHFESKFNYFLGTDDERTKIPQIWSVLVLLSRASLYLLETVLRANSMLKIIEKCFNHSDVELNIEAFAAWDRAIFSTHQVLRTKPSILKVLRSPIIGTFQRKSNNESTSRVRERAFLTYCNLLYYSFGLSRGFEEYFWKEAVENVFLKTTIVDVSDLEARCTLLASLLSESKLRVWQSDRAIDGVRNPIAAEEVPRLAPHWIRDNTVSVLRVVECLFLKNKVPSSDTKRSCVIKVWCSLLEGISQAGEKEITASQELKSSIAEIMSFIYRLFAKAHNTEGREPSMQSLQLSELADLMKATVQYLGTVHLAEKVLLQTGFGKFEPTVSPSTHRKPTSAMKRSPIVAMLKLLSKWPLTPENDNPLSDVVQALLTMFWERATSPRTWLALLRDCAEVLNPSLPTRNNANRATSQVWRGVANVCSSNLLETLSSDRDRAQSTPSPHIHEYCLQILHILQSGLQFPDRDSLAAGESLCFNLRSFVTENYGNATFFVALIHPLSKSLHSENTTCSTEAIMHYSSWILGASSDPPTTRAIQHAMKVLRKDLATTAGEDPYELIKSFFHSVNCSLLVSYKQSPQVDWESIRSFLLSFSSFLDSGAFTRQDETLLELFFYCIQSGLSCWARDEDEKLTNREVQAVENLSDQVLSVWSAMLRLLSSAFENSTVSLDAAKGLLMSGMRSHSRSVVNVTISTWNSTLGYQYSLAYPPDLYCLVTRLQQHVDIQLPENFSKSTAKSFVAEMDDNDLFPWLEENEQAEPTRTSKDLFHQFSSPTPRAKRPENALTPTRRPRSSEQRHGRTPPPRLRHDDSQMQFIAIESSPLNEGSYNSQNLTEHQKDVRSRQQQDMSLFSDIRSSPSAMRLGHNSAPFSATNEQHNPTAAESFGVDGDDVEASAVQSSGGDELAQSGSSPLRSHANACTSHPGKNARSYISHQLDGAADDLDQDMPSSPPELRRNSQHDNDVTSTELLVGSSYLKQTTSDEQDMGKGVDEEFEFRTTRSDYQHGTHSEDRGSVEAPELPDKPGRLIESTRSGNELVPFIEEPHGGNENEPRNLEDDHDVFVDAVTSPPSRLVGDFRHFHATERHLQELSPNAPSSSFHESNFVDNKTTQAARSNSPDASLEEEPASKEPEPRERGDAEHESNLVESQMTEPDEREDRHTVVSSTENEPPKTSNLSQDLITDNDCYKKRTARPTKRFLENEENTSITKKPRVSRSLSKTVSLAAAQQQTAQATGNVDEDEVIIVRPRAENSPTMLQLLSRQQVQSSSQERRHAGGSSGPRSSLKRDNSAMEPDVEPGSETHSREGAEREQLTAISKRRRYESGSQGSQEEASLKSSQRRSSRLAGSELPEHPPDLSLRKTRSRSKSSPLSSQVSLKAGNNSPSPESQAIAQIESERPSNMADKSGEVNDTQTSFPHDIQALVLDENSQPVSKSDDVALNDTEQLINSISATEAPQPPQLNHPLLTTMNDTADAVEDATEQRSPEPPAAQQPTSAFLPVSPNRTTSTPPSPSKTVAQNLVARLGRILSDARALVLGHADDEQRRQLEDLSFDLQREIVQAGRRGREQ